ncbi:MAG: thioredoxin family protein [Acidobacteriota bacterium]|nr:thioredoxin family protein [Acidobacteriota bacterium]
MRASFLSCILTCIAAALPAQFDSPIPKTDLVKLTGTIHQKNGDAIGGVITATIEKGWHVNSAHPLESFAIPTTLSFDSADGVKADFPPHVIKSFTFSGGTKLAVYEGTIAIPFTAKLKNGAQAITASLHYQACNDNVCLPPRNATLLMSLSGGRSPSAVSPVAPPSQNFTPLSAAPKDRLTSTFLSHGLPLTLLILFLGGLALNLTPCVFPMIPITIGFFAMQSDGRRSRRLALSASYVGGLVIMYSALGVAAALSGKLFGSWLQNPAVLIGLAILMLVLASSMFGVWEFRVPQFIANRSGGRAGLAGAAVMGLFVGIVAAPCVGPVVVALFTLVAGIGKPLIGFVMFGALALGLGSPYLIALNAMPRPGEWMVQVKKAMGFVLIAMAVYFVRPLIGDDAFRWGVAASLLIGAAFLFLSRGVGQRGGRVLRLACASLLLIAGAAFALPRPSGAIVQWQKYDSSAIANAGKPVVIDFYADWCLPCKELDEKTFSDRAVAGELDRFVRIKADLTNDQDATVQRLTQQYRIVGVPTVVFLDSSGHELDAQRLTGFEKPDAFLARLKQVR